MLKWCKTLNLKVIQQAEGSTNCHQRENATYSIKKNTLLLGNKNKQINKLRGKKEPKNACILE